MSREVNIRPMLAGLLIENTERLVSDILSVLMCKIRHCTGE